MVEFIDAVFKYIEMPVEILTIVISLIGAIVSFQHGVYFRKIRNELAVRIRKNFLWDAALYMVTFVMGVGLLLNWTWLVQVDIIIRPFVLFFAVYASMRLYNHYKQIDK